MVFSSDWGFRFWMLRSMGEDDGDTDCDGLRPAFGHRSNQYR
ncbi:hypothetical protein [Acaryochloris marina]|uniref:Uncharacterized protein n=1 Tax=Acaryochloris marina (strain MBIC 11017) TaxID=329726 RepID=B0C591_ACAM1|nr:hypothetical protein [Acaryochloris marina]ABW26331.1 hypothetical protein AM1_1294 [Acaryochloris marina MBIC11017]